MWQERTPGRAREIHARFVRWILFLMDGVGLSDAGARMALSGSENALERVSTCHNWPEVGSTYTVGPRSATREGYPFPRRP